MLDITLATLAGMTGERCDGIVLAAGAVTRYGMPKAPAEDGAWLHSALRALRDGGCDRIFVVLGATGLARREETALDPVWLVSQPPRIPLPAGVHPVWASYWAIGLSASIRTGLAAVASFGAVDTPRLRNIRAPKTIAAGAIPPGARGNAAGGGIGPPEFAAIMPVDTPDVGPDVVARVLAAARASEGRLARAVFGKVPGHPVVLGRGHWPGTLFTATGDSGGVQYLGKRPDTVCVPCDDLTPVNDQDYRSGPEVIGSQ